MSSPHTTADPTVKAVADKVRGLIKQGSVSPFSVMDIVATACQLCPDWGIVEDVVCEIAKGADGVEGTADDLIPAATLNTLVVVLRTGVVRDIATWLAKQPRPAVPQTQKKKSGLCCFGA